MKNKILMTCIGSLLAAALTGCASAGRADVQASYIGDEAAKSIALAAAQLSGTDTTSTAKLVQQNDILYYEVDFSANGQDYHYAIDAMTGAIIESTGDAATATPAPAQPSTSGSTSTPAPAQASTPQAAAGATGKVDENEAKRIALADAGVQEADTAYLRVVQDIDDGILVFDVEFFVAASSMEYDYEIDAATGTIRSKDFDSEGYAPAQAAPGTTAGATKTEQEIRKIALAKVPGATDKHIQLMLDNDNGRLCYEGKIIYNNMEYEFEIDAYSGDIREWSAESVFD